MRKTTARRSGAARARPGKRPAVKDSASSVPRRAGGARSGAARPSTPVRGRAAGEDDIRVAISRFKRERILAVAVELFHSNGLGKTTLEEVARRMNVTKPFIYAQFKSKEDLLAEICSCGIRASLKALDEALASGGSAAERIRTLARNFMLAVIENQAYIAIYTREQKHLSVQSRDAIFAMRREFDRKICALLAEGVASGDFIVDDIQVASLSISGLISWSYGWYRPDGRLGPAELADRIADLVLALVRARPLRREPRQARARRESTSPA
jgi:AcrR family transcriptional regulator